jgi:hypothetical protein
VAVTLPACCVSRGAIAQSHEQPAGSAPAIRRAVASAPWSRATVYISALCESLPLRRRASALRSAAQVVRACRSAPCSYSWGTRRAGPPCQVPRSAPRFYALDLRSGPGYDAAGAPDPQPPSVCHAGCDHRNGPSLRSQSKVSVDEPESPAHSNAPPTCQLGGAFEWPGFLAKPHTALSA